MTRFSYRRSRSLMLACAAVMPVVAAAGWISGNIVLASFYPGWKAMAPLTIVSLSLLCLSLFLCESAGWKKKLSFVFLSLSTLVLFAVAAERLHLTGFRFEYAIIPHALSASLTSVNTGTVSPLTLVILTTASVGCILYLVIRSGIRESIIAFAGVLMGSAGVIDIFGYVYDNPVLSGIVSCPTGIAFIFIGSAMLFSAEPESFPARVIAGARTSAIILRHILPVILVTVVAGGLAYRIPGVLRYDRLLAAATIIIAFVILTVFLCARISARMGYVIERLAEDREAARAAHAKAENRYETLVESLQEGIAIVDERGVIGYANPRFAEMTGIGTPSIGMSFFECIPHDDVCTEEFSHCIRSGNIVRKDCELKGGVDGRRYASITLVPFTKMGELYAGAIVGVVDITEKKETERRLVESIENREVLLRELYHRTKNNMQVICSLIRLRIADLNDDRSRAFFREIEGRILSMALVHEKLYESKNLARIDVAKYTEDLAKIMISHAMENGEKIRVQIDIPEITVPIDIAIPYGLMVTELMTNTYKHAFPDESKGTVRLVMRWENGDLVSFTYADDGRGTPGDFNPGDQRSFGMRMIMNLVEHQLHGSVRIDGREGFNLRAIFPCPVSDRMTDIPNIV